MNKNLVFKKLRQLSKEVCLSICQKKLVDCPKDCKFQKLLIEIVDEVNK